MIGLVSLAGAVALLLWGVRMVRTAAERALGQRLETTMRIVTRNRVSSMAVGIVSALMLQSATAVTLLAAGFHATGTMALVQVLAVILGAEIGSGLAAVILSQDLSAIVPILLLAGYVIFSNSVRRVFKHLARAMLGLAFIMIALSMISESTATMRDVEMISALTGVLESDTALTILLFAAFTWLVHSSLAVVLIIAQLLSGGNIAGETALFMVLGANLGASFPALSSGWAMGPQGRQPLIYAFLFRGVTVAAGFTLLAFIEPFALLEQVPYLSAVVAFHLGLNFATSVALMPFLGIAGWIARRMVKTPVPDVGALPGQPIYLAKDDIENPARAMANVANETLRIAQVAHQMLETTLRAFYDPTLVDQIRKLDDDIDRIHTEATYYLASIKSEDDDSDPSDQWLNTFDFATDLEHVGDIIDASLMTLAKRMHKSQLKFSTEGKRELEDLHGQLLEIFRLSQAVFISKDPALAKELIEAKRAYRGSIQASRLQHSRRINQQVSASLSSSRVHLDILRDFQRISSFLTSNAYALIERQRDKEKT